MYFQKLVVPTGLHVVLKTASRSNHRLRDFKCRVVQKNLQRPRLELVALHTTRQLIYSVRSVVRKHNVKNCIGWSDGTVTSNRIKKEKKAKNIM